MCNPTGRQRKSLATPIPLGHIHTDTLTKALHPAHPGQRPDARCSCLLLIPLHPLIATTVSTHLVGQVVPLCSECADVVPRGCQVPLSVVVTLLQLTHLKPGHSTAQHNCHATATTSGWISAALHLLLADCRSCTAELRLCSHLTTAA